MRSTKSLSASAFSSKSLKVKNGTGTGTGKALFLEPDLDFEKELSEACTKFECSGVVVYRGIQNDDFYQNLKSQDPRKKVMVPNKKMSATPVSTTVVPDELKKIDDVTGTTSTTYLTDDFNHIAVDALYDNQNELVEIRISRARHIPRKLMQCIGLLCPYFKYLAKISITKSQLNIYILHELSKMLPMSYLTDVDLDGSFLSKANFAILLNEKTKLRNLSLSKCRINDEVCELIAAKLDFTAPAAKSLMLLNLSSNHITDIGMQSLARALKTNRCLRYLNLADNRITDVGALQLFDVLTEFPLMCDEIIQKRARYIDYLRRKRAIYMDYFDDDTRSLEESSRKSATVKRSKAASIASTIASTRKSKKSTGDLDAGAATKAELMSLELLGPYVDPYSPDCTKIKDDVSYCKGNLALAYLNLAYNSLSYLSLMRLKSVLLYQSGLQISNCGLVKVVFDGNPIPNCNEIDTVGQLLMTNVLRAAPDGKRRPSGAAKPSKK